MYKDSSKKRELFLFFIRFRENRGTLASEKRMP